VFVTSTWSLPDIVQLVERLNVPVLEVDAQFHSTPFIKQHPNAKKCNRMKSTFLWLWFSIVGSSETFVWSDFCLNSKLLVHYFFQYRCQRKKQTITKWFLKTTFWAYDNERRTLYRYAAFALCGLALQYDRPRFTDLTWIRVSPILKCAQVLNKKQSCLTKK